MSSDGASDSLASEVERLYAKLGQGNAPEPKRGPTPPNPGGSRAQRRRRWRWAERVTSGKHAGEVPE